MNEEIVEAYIERNLSDVETKPAIFTDTAKMYAEAKPDAVTIVTPHTMHFEHGMQAIEAGLHVFMEKPMVTDSGDAHKLKEAVEKSGKVLVVGYNTSCTPRAAMVARSDSREQIRQARNRDRLALAKLGQGHGGQLAPEPRAQRRRPDV